MKIGVVIPSINLWESYTKPCIDSIKTKHEYRIVLVDNGSTDGTREEAGKLVSTTFAHRRYEENKGCQSAWNFGIKDSFEKGCDYVLVINNDILLHKDAIDRLVDRFEKAKTTLIPLKQPLASDLEAVGGVTDSSSLFREGYESEVLGMVTCMDVRGELPVPTMINVLDPDFKKDCPESEHPNFSAFMINKMCWDKVGEVDELFFPAYYEDNDYHYRIIKAGLKAIVYPPAMFYHFASRTQNEALPRPIVQTSNNREKYVEKWGGIPGEENFDVPYNDKSKTLKSVKQCP